MCLYLASASPRRRSLLAQIGVECTPVAAAVDETRLAREPLRTYVCRLAVAKAQAGAAAVADRSGGGWALGADTLVVLGDQSLGKPRDRDDAREMLRLLAGQTHEVWTAFACVSVEDGVVPAVGRPECVRTRITFCPVDPSGIERWLDQGEWADKAGAYAVQGYAARFVTRLEGSYSGTVGLPLYEVSQMLARLKGR